MFVDFHAHILPKADHGSDSLEMSLSQLRNAAAAGVDTIVATPHFYPAEDNIKDFLARRESCFKRLSEANDTGVNIVLGAEVFLGTGIERLKGLSELCIEGTDYILIEPPPEPWAFWVSDSFISIIRDLRLRPICAHIDRYSDSGQDKIFNLNIDIQMNASAMLNSRKLRRKYLNYIADDMIHLLGSDVHGDGTLAYRDFSAAIKRIGDMTPYLMDNARKILKHSSV